MFYSFLTIILYLALSKSFSQQFTCPRKNLSLPIDGAYRDPIRCNIYYHCINGTSFGEQSCPTGYHFQLKTDSCKFTVCVPAKESDCQENGTTPYAETILRKQKAQMLIKNKVDECTRDKNETVGHYDDCQLYYHCYNGVAMEQRCPNGYLFTPKVNFKHEVARLCVTKSEASCPINGQWSSWSTWSECRGVCGKVGKRERKRECNDPPPMSGGRFCTEDSIQTENCDVAQCNNTLSFCVSMRRSQELDTGSLTWTKISVNNNNMFDDESQSVKVNKTGFYLFSISGTVSANKGFKFQNIRKPSVSGLSSPVTNLSLNTMSRQYGGKLSLSEKIYISQESLDNVQVVGSENNKETSWSGFRYETDAYIYATTSRPQSHHDDFHIVYDSYEYNGFYWYHVDNYPRFQSESTGYFYVSFGIGVPAFSKCDAIVEYTQFNQKLTMNGKNKMSIDSSFSSSHIIKSLSIRPHFRFYSFSPTYSSKYHETYLLVLKLNPSKVIFFAKNNLPSFSEGKFSKVRFNEDEIIDNFDGWKTKTDTYVIPSIGSYYINAQFEVDISKMNHTELQLRINDESYLYMARDATYFSGPITNSAVFNLKKNDRIELFSKGAIDDTVTFTIFEIN